MDNELKQLNSLEKRMEKLQTDLIKLKLDTLLKQRSKLGATKQDEDARERIDYILYEYSNRYKESPSFPTSVWTYYEQNPLFEGLVDMIQSHYHLTEVEAVHYLLSK